MIEAIKKFFHRIYHQLVEINDTPQRTALGFGIGVFLGIFPGMGPIAALVAAFILRVNRAAALLGSVLTNTWFSLVTLGLAINIGSKLSGANGQAIRDVWDNLIKDFHWQKLWEPSVKDALLAIMVGFIVVAFVFAVVVYLISLFILIQRQKGRKA